MKGKYHISDMPVRELNTVFIENFYLYLRNVCGISNNTAMKFVQRFRTVLSYARNTGLDFIDPFANYKFNFDRVDRGYLEQAEIDKIYNKALTSKRLEQVRDMFIFSCYTGLSYIDLCNLTAENIRTILITSKTVNSLLIMEIKQTGILYYLSSLWKIVIIMM